MTTEEELRQVRAECTALADALTKRTHEFVPDSIDPTLCQYSDCTCGSTHPVHLTPAVVCTTLFRNKFEENDSIDEFYAEVIRAFGILSDWFSSQKPPPIQTVGTAQALGYCALRAIHKLSYICDLTVAEVISRLVEETPVSGDS